MRAGGGPLERTRPGGGSPALEARDLAVAFGPRTGLEGLSFSVERGQRLALVGRSGVGKTSLLRTLSGAVSPRGGRVLVGGTDVTGAPPDGRDCVLLSQRPLLFPHLSVFENVAFPLRVRGVPRAEIAPRVRAALAAVRLEALGGRAPHELSGGQAHRVAVARAVVARPAVLLLDEPLASLDPALREEVRQAILAVHTEYRPALVLVTHDLAEAGRMATHVGVLLENGIAQLGTPEEVFRRPATEAVARFLGLPNRIACRVVEGGLLLPGGIRVPRPGGASPAGAAAGAGLVAGHAAVAVFGPDAVRIHPRGGTGVAARIVAVHHRPDGVSVEVAVARSGEGAPLHLEASGDPACASRAGEDVDLELRGDRMHVFPAERGKRGWDAP